MEGKGPDTRKGDNVDWRDVEIGIGSYRYRMEEAGAAAIALIEQGEFEEAAQRVAQAQGFKTAMRELEFMSECMEVKND